MELQSELPLITPSWPVSAKGVSALSTRRSGGSSQAPFDSFNLGLHVGDDPAAVLANRQRLQALLGPVTPVWLNQVHGTAVINGDLAYTKPPAADATVITERRRAAVIMTADCLPVLFAAADGSVVAAAHAGWRGLVGGVLEHTIKAMAVDPEQIYAWLGPCIGAQAFEVGPEVRAAYLAKNPHHDVAFVRSENERWFADLHTLAKQTLATVGVHACWAEPACTYQQSAEFFSYRRDGTCGRMATLIWRD